MPCYPPFLGPGVGRKGERKEEEENLQNYVSSVCMCMCVCKHNVYQLSVVTAQVPSVPCVASYPGSRWAGKERAWYTLFAHAFNLPKIWGLRGIF